MDSTIAGGLGDFKTEIRTVRHLAACLTELQESASTISGVISPTERGYFSASEDESVKALVVSYWQTRSAALSLIDDLDFRFANQAVENECDRDSIFLLGFSVALLLVGAARFLRDQTSGRPVVRAKLNQPISDFSVPGGAYDTIQKSLSSSSHAWRLYQAREYWRLNESRIRAAAKMHGLEDLADLVEWQSAQLDVSLKKFARFRWRTRLDQMIRCVGRTLFLKPTYRVQKLSSSMMADVYVRRDHRPQLPTEIVKSLESVAMPGDVFLVRKEFAVTNYFLPGYWPHAALYLGTPEELQQLQVDAKVGDQRWSTLQAAAISSPNPTGRCVLEAMKDGVNLRCWNSPLGSDSIVILRPRLSAAEIGGSLARGLAHEGKSYDFDFNFGSSDRLVCTEVIYRAYDGVGEMDFPLIKRAGRPTLSGADLIDMALISKNFSVHAAWIPSQATGPANSPAALVVGDQAHPLVESVHRSV